MTPAFILALTSGRKIGASVGNHASYQFSAEYRDFGTPRGSDELACSRILIIRDRWVQSSSRPRHMIRGTTRNMNRPVKTNVIQNPELKTVNRRRFPKRSMAPRNAPIWAPKNTPTASEPKTQRNAEAQDTVAPDDPGQIWPFTLKL